MRVTISARGENDPDWHHMIVDGYGMLIDLEGLPITAVDDASLTDPTILEVNWGPVLVNGEGRECGTIHLVDGTKRTFWDKSILAPYLRAFEDRKAILDAEYQAAKAASR